MANPIKYTNATQSNSIKTSNFAIGVNNGGYGPTNITNFYNGKTPNVGGYTVYVSNGVGSPSVFVAGNDANLITLSNQLGGSGITTISAALNFFNSSTTMLCTNMDYPNIVTSGLVLNLDAAYTPSYPKNGTTWTDLSGNGNNGTLVNGPSFSSLDGGSIVFDGTDDYVLISDKASLNSTSGLSLSFFIKKNTNSRMYFVDKHQTGQFGYFGYIDSTNLIFFRFGLNSIQTNTDVILNNQWYYITINGDTTKRSIFLNGIELITTTASNIWSSSSEPLILCNTLANEGAVNGNVNLISLYNRSLTEKEILQNYYAGLQRFIPTDGLVLSLDGSNTDKQVATASTAYDMSGNNNNGTLNNGVALVSDGQRAFSFDGVNDVVTTSFNTLPSSTTWTIWVKRTQSVNNFNMMMGMSLPYFAFRSNGDIHFSNSIGDVQRSLFATPNLANNVWYFMSFVSSFSAGNTTMLIYLNGSLQSQRTDVGQQKTTTDNNFRLGGWTNTGTEPFKGNIGQVGIYNRVLTATEISTIYTASKSRYTPSTTEIKNVFKSRVLEDLGLFEAESCLEGQLNVISNQYLLESASLMVTANAYKEGKLYSVVPFELNGDMVVTRATTGTRVNADGFIEQVPYNLFSRSEEFDNTGVWVRQNILSISTNVANSPIGTLTADKIIPDTTLNQHRIFQQFNFSGPGVLSVYAKADGYNFLSLAISGGVGGQSIYFNLSNGTISGTASGFTPSIENVGNGWYRCSIFRSDLGAGVNLSYWIIARESATTNNYVGNGTSGILVWGAQLVQGTQAKDYFPTTNRFNIPRIDYSNGSCPSILVEPQRTNLVIESERINVWTGGLNTTVTPNVSIGPNGIQTANNINITNINGYWRRLGLNLVSSTTYTASVFVKKSATTNNKTFSFYYNNNVSSPNNGEYRAVVNLTNLTITTTPTGTITTGRPTIISSLLSDYGSGWYRVIVIFTTGSSAGNSNCEIGFLANGEVVDFDAWGAQLETGTNATSYIPTTTATATRNADLIASNLLNYNTTSYSIFFDIEYLADFRDSTTQSGDISASPLIWYFRRLNSTSVNFWNQNAQQNLGSFSFSPANSQKRFKGCLVFNGSTISTFINGVKIGNQITPTTLAPYTTFLNSGTYRLVTTKVNLVGGFDASHLVRLMYILPTNITDAQAINITTL